MKKKVINIIKCEGSMHVSVDNNMGIYQATRSGRKLKYKTNKV